MNEDRLQLLIPAIGLIMSLGGIIIIDLASKPIPEILTITAGGFATWATGVAIKNASQNGKNNGG